MIEFACDNCGRQIRVSDEHARKIGTCNDCGKKLTIPVVVVEPPERPREPERVRSEGQPARRPVALIVSLAVGIPAIVIAISMTAFFATRSAETERDRGDDFLKRWKAEQAESKKQEQELKAQFRDAFQKLVRSHLKWECEFVSKGEVIYPSQVYGRGEVIVSNAYGAKKRVDWRITLNDEFKKRKSHDRLAALDLLDVLPGDHVLDFSIGNWTVYKDGKLINEGKIISE